MENMINRIVEMDKKAQAITEAAQEEKQRAEKDIAAQTEQLREQYLERARQRIAENDAKERAAAEAEWKQQAARYVAQKQAMDALYAAQKSQWVTAITDAVING